jgi:hypothetical protein
MLQETTFFKSFTLRRVLTVAVETLQRSGERETPQRLHLAEQLVHRVARVELQPVNLVCRSMVEATRAGQLQLLWRR